MNDDPEELEITPEFLADLEERLADIGLSAYITEEDGGFIVDLVSDGENVSTIGSTDREDAEHLRVSLLIAAETGARAMAKHLADDEDEL